MAYVYRMFPDMVAPLLESIIGTMIYERSQAGIFLGAVVALWSTSMAVNTLVNGIHLAYGVIDNRNRIIKQLIGMFYSLLLAFIIIAMIVLLIFGSRLGQYIMDLVLDRYPVMYTIIWDLARTSMSALLILFGSVVIHRVIPRKHIKTRKLWVGILFTAISWYVFSGIFAFYIDYFSNYSTMYGSIGGIFVLLIWLNANGLFILIGAEINAIRMIRISKKTISEQLKKY